MGAKDALCKAGQTRSEACDGFTASASEVATLNIGLEDTLAYYSPDEFVVAQACVSGRCGSSCPLGIFPPTSRRSKAAGFKKTMAFQPRVIKQNRGSSGEGIWIIKLAEGNYCKEYGERSCEDGEVLKLMEANDNHEETHTVAEFIEFCVSGPHGQVRRVDLQGRRKVPRGRQGGRWPAGGPALLPAHRGRPAVSDSLFVDLALRCAEMR